MKRYFDLILIILVLLSLLFFLMILLQGRDELAKQSHPGGDGQPIPVELGEAPPGQGIPSAEPKTPAVGDVVGVGEEILLPVFPVSLQYDQYRTTYTYFVVERGDVTIFSGPSPLDKVLRKAARNEKLDYVETVLIKTGEGSSAPWYHVSWQEKGEARFGFVEGSMVSRRFFQFDKMEQAVLKAAEYAGRSKLTYIDNYKNQKGYAPLYYGKTTDSRGSSRSQSAPGYPSLSNTADFFYIGDGTLVRYLFSAGDFVKVEVVADGETCYVPGKYIPAKQTVFDLSIIIVVDRKYQNEAVYENGPEGWTLISCTLATTGTTGEYSRPTPLGFYYAMARRSQFLYYQDGTYTIQGYAPYAIRFAGGAYVHGVPVNYKYNSEGERITPPKVEYATSIGTAPLSHKCVRNYTSHAKFLYDRYTPGEVLVIVIE